MVLKDIWILSSMLNSTPDKIEEAMFGLIYVSKEDIQKLNDVLVLNISDRVVVISTIIEKYKLHLTSTEEYDNKLVEDRISQVNVAVKQLQKTLQEDRAKRYRVWPTSTDPFPDDVLDVAISIYIIIQTRHLEVKNLYPPELIIIQDNLSSITDDELPEIHTVSERINDTLSKIPATYDGFYSDRTECRVSSAQTKQVMVELIDDKLDSLVELLTEVDLEVKNINKNNMKLLHDSDMLTSIEKYEYTRLLLKIERMKRSNLLNFVDHINRQIDMIQRFFNGVS